MTDSTRPIARRAIVSALGGGVVALGAAAGARDASAETAPWRPSLEGEDDWLELPGRHRLVFDATSADGAGYALFYARNYVAVNMSGYGLDPAQLATVIILRHFATVFGYDDAIWAKHGATLAKMSGFKDPKTNAPPVRNLYDVKGYAQGLANADATFSGLAADNVRFAVCGAATQKIAEALASATQRKAAEVRDELVAHLIPNGRIVPAGIVTVNRAQERGYALSYTG